MHKIYKATIRTNSWTKNILSIVNNLGFSFITEKSSIQSFMGSIKQRITDQCLQEESAKIYNSPKLNFYHVIFDNFKRCACIDILTRISFSIYLLKIQPAKAQQNGNLL